MKVNANNIDMTHCNPAMVADLRDGVIPIKTELLGVKHGT